MSTTLKTAFLTVAALTLVAGSAHADVISGVDSSYGTASHVRDTWQEIADTSVCDDYGITWSTDGGQTFGRDGIDAGDTVTFRIAMHEDNFGSHYANLMKIWVDTDQDGSFDDSDAIAFDWRRLRFTEGSDVANTNTDWYTTGEITIDDDFSGDLAIRGRVTCTDSLMPTAYQWDYSKQEYNEAFHADDSYYLGGAFHGALYQGESEDWTVTVTSCPTDPVPEPATLLLFGVGLAGLAGLSRRKKK